MTITIQPEFFTYVLGIVVGFLIGFALARATA